MSLRDSSLAAIALLLGGMVSTASAGSYTVKPVRIDLSAKQARTTVQVLNLGDEPTTIQAHIVSWMADGVEEVLTENDEILLNPPIFTIGPGQQQMMRLGLRHPQPSGQEWTYRLILEEVPHQPKPGFMGVQTILKISVPIFVKPAASAPALSWKVEQVSADELRLSVENSGNAHVQIQQIAVSGTNRPEPDFVKNAVSYVLRRGRKEWLIPSRILSSGGELKIDARTDNGDVRENVALPRR